MHFGVSAKETDQMELGMDSLRGLSAVVKADFAANPRDIKSRAVLLLFRICQFAMANREEPRMISYPLVAAYRFWTEFSIGMELRPKTCVGPGLTIFHGYSLVVNDHARIGANVVLRNGVVIGQKEPGGGSPVLEDGVVVGAGAIILGPITIGRGAVIGAGSVVTRSVLAGDTVVGNPARTIRQTTEPRDG